MISVDKEDYAELVARCEYINSVIDTLHAKSADVFEGIKELKCIGGNERSFIGCTAAQTAADRLFIQQDLPSGRIKLPLGRRQNNSAAS